MLDHLIHYLRTSLPEIRSESSTLGREAELARAYLEILRLRMGGALEIAIDIPADLARAPFPPLMVMTLVENAIKHGVAPQGRGHVSVSASAANGKLRVVVQDDGRGLDGTLGRGVGLANVRERLGAIFGAQARLDLEGRADGGTRATIEVPER
jgi:LytS/YehU family sensor histidine kinase